MIRHLVPLGISAEMVTILGPALVLVVVALVLSGCESWQESEAHRGHTAAAGSTPDPATYARALIAQDGQHSDAEWLASGVLKPRYQAALEAVQ